MAEEAKSVITIDVDATAFENFKKLFDEFQAALDKLPAQWAAINAAQTATQANTVEQAKSAAEKVTKVYDDVSKKEERRKAKEEKTAAERHAKQLAKAKSKEEKEALIAAENERKKTIKAEEAAKKIAAKEDTVRRAQAAKREAEEKKNLEDRKKLFLDFASKGLLVVPEIAAAALAVQAAYKFAESAADTRRTARGYGVTASQLNAIKDTYGTLLSDPEGLLGNIAQAQTSYAGRSKLQVLSNGAISAEDAKNKSAAELYPEVLKAIRERYQENPTEEYAKAKFIDEFLPEADRRALGQARQEEIDQLRAMVKSQTALNKTNDTSLKAWGDLWTSIKQLGTGIWNIVATVLSPAAVILKMVFDSISMVLSAFTQMFSFLGKLLATLFWWVPGVGNILEQSFGKFGDKNPDEASRSPTARPTDDAQKAQNSTSPTSYTNSTPDAKKANAATQNAQNTLANYGEYSPQAMGMALGMPAISSQRQQQAGTTQSGGGSGGGGGGGGGGLATWFSSLFNKNVEAPSPQTPTDTGAQNRSDAANGGMSRAERNHNWGNLRATTAQRLFHTVDTDEKGFRKFNSDAEGFKAMQHQLQLYNGRGLNTLTSIISKWAPPSENATGAYIQRVAKDTGFDPNAQLNLNDPAVMSKLIAAMARVESGKNKYSGDQVKILIQNNTGGSAVVSASTMAGVQGTA